ncbi:MAG: peptidylprolyl isomerase [Mariprofundaceae bacterium]
MNLPFMALTLFLLTFNTAQAKPLDAIAATVNGNAITCYEVAAEKGILIKQLQETGQTDMPANSILSKKALDIRIKRILEKFEAQKLEVSINAKELHKALMDIETRNNIPQGQLGEALVSQGLDFEHFKASLREQLLASKVINLAVRSKLKISEESMREYYRKYLADPKPAREIQLSHIFIALPQSPNPEQVQQAENKIKSLQKQLQNGKDFVQIVTLESDDPNAKQGGVMGWFFAGSIAPQFNEVFELSVGDISQPIRSPVGFHLVRVNEDRWTKPSAGESYDEVHARHILIKLPTSIGAETEAKIRYRAETIAREMKAASNEDFALRAEEASQGPSAKKGGDLGWFRSGMMVKAFEDVAFSMSAGDTSDVVESEFGLHVIRLLAKRHVDPDSFEAHHDKIEQLLINAEMQSQVPRWMAGLKSKATIERKVCQ